jgi:hypothetical protein
LGGLAWSLAELAAGYGSWFTGRECRSRLRIYSNTVNRIYPSHLIENMQQRPRKVHTQSYASLYMQVYIPFTVLAKLHPHAIQLNGIIFPIPMRACTPGTDYRPLISIQESASTISRYISGSLALRIPLHRNRRRYTQEINRVR